MIQAGRPGSFQLSDPIDDPCFGGVVWRHLHLDLVSDHEANESLPHFTRNVGQNFVITGEFDLEHGSRQNRGNRALHLDGLILPVSSLLRPTVFTAPSPAPASPSSSWWSRDNSILGFANWQSAHPRGASLLILAKPQSKTPIRPLIFRADRPS